MRIPTRPHAPRSGRPARQRGVGLFDSVAALAVLAFGLLGLTKLQGRMVSTSTDVQTRATAAMLANQLVGYALIDPSNRACYTLPAAGTCASTQARAQANKWKEDALKALPNAVDATAELKASNTQLSVKLSWTSHALAPGSDGALAREDRSITVTTDVR